jgi:hypothetical protein
MVVLGSLINFYQFLVFHFSIFFRAFETNIFVPGSGQFKKTAQDSTSRGIREFCHLISVNVSYYLVLVTQDVKVFIIYLPHIIINS